ncbi:hypothetical protein MKW92_017249 [Papaver armeniacum]|nr:hypothetical protein MKW92_017249 [Papaver armeniacum]
MKSFGVVVALLVLLNLTSCHGALQSGFYNGKCGTNNVESIIRNVVRQRFARDPTIVAALLDCNSTIGCDASLLLDGSSSEKTSPPNFSVRGYDLIDQIKAALERACPRLVSCADIIAVATRDAVALARGMNYRVQTGRRDGFSGQARNVNLPGPFNFSPFIHSFLRQQRFHCGGHTVGITHCSFIQDRLFNFRNTGRPDPSMNPTLRNQLRGRCPQGSPFDNLINLDQTPGSSLVLEEQFFEIDQSMASHPSDQWNRFSLANNGASFQTQFGAAMIKWELFRVLTGRSGE